MATSPEIMPELFPQDEVPDMDARLKLLSMVRKEATEGIIKAKARVSARIKGGSPTFKKGDKVFQQLGVYLAIRGAGFAIEDLADFDHTNVEFNMTHPNHDGPSHPESG
ncbi:uncharacterized protein LAESUDRAFT_760742 [Laetiporus sulphureus 93-53]|uniref:Uncharacterized protein n=1 Tax=Laetiporus sulphureus 93-53 TaxID=1314785 RepID=A0A165DJH5_9APHY|nr:uncharacterized protein LAESUDRAFT_760742 [Laetiporus sulphureus 93-53]KZT05018.1 hypothetical protein LAESUDRAFT_760742 [Laetiporus sulphureus 93-53]